MNRKRRVTFNVNSSLQYSAEFHENTKLKMLKSYFKDVSHIDKFNLMNSNSTYLNNDESSIRDIYGNSKEIFLRVLKVSDDDISNNKFYTQQLINENQILKSEIRELKQHNNELLFIKDGLNIKIDELTVKCENYEREIEKITQQNLNFRYIINDLKNNYFGLKSETETMKFKYEMNKTAFENTIKSIKIFETDGNKINIFKDSLKVQNQETFKILLTTINDNHRQISLSERRSQMKKFSAQLIQKNIGGGKALRKSISCKNIERPILKEIKTNQLELNYNSNNSLTKKNLFFTSISNEPSDKVELAIQHWTIILKFLDKTDRLNLSITNKHFSFICNLFCEQIASINLKLLEDNMKIQNKQKSNSFSMNTGTISCLKLLNKIDIKTTFHEAYLIPDEAMLVYRILFQITKLSDYNILMTNKDFNKFVVNYFILNKIDYIGDHLNILISKFDFSKDNIDKIRELIEKFNTKVINSTNIGKIDKTAGLISFLIKDVLTFCGLVEPDLEKRLRKKSNSSLELLQDKRYLKESNLKIAKIKIVIDKLKNIKKFFKISKENA